MKLSIPWNQYALIVLLAEKMQERGIWFGKTALQKLIYLLQVVYKVPLKYQFSLYIHGPFCSDLMDDLDYLAALDGVSVTYNHNINGYSISPSKEAELIKSKAREFLADYKEQIDMLLDNFGFMRARDLELRTTIIFVDRDAVRSKRDLSREEFIQELHDIKPHFTREEIEKAMVELENWGYIERRKRDGG